MDKKQEDSRDLLRDVISLLENNKLLDLRELLEEYHIMDIFDVMEHLDEDKKIKLFEVLPIDMSASILEESGPEFFRSILSNIDQEHGKNILEQMSLDDLTDILSEIEEDERHRIMNLLSKEDADDVKELLVYDEDSAGGIMTTGYIEINKNMTAKEAIDHMRENALDAETIYYIYVVDNDEKLVGVLSLRELITARDSVIVEDLMSENIIFINIDILTNKDIFKLFIMIYVPRPPISPQTMPVIKPTKISFTVLLVDTESLEDMVIIVMEDDCIPILPPKHNITGKNNNIFT